MATSWRQSEKCGVVGMFVGSHFTLADSLTAQKALEHRGNGPAGLAILLSDGSVIHKIATSIDELPDPLIQIKKLPKKSSKLPVAVIRHNRYATAGALSGYTQPLVVSLENFTLCFAHNGNLPAENVATLRPLLQKNLPADASDSAVMAQLLIEYRPKFKTWLQTFSAMLPLFKGAFSLTCLTEDQELFAIRDPYGIRPLCLGQKNGSWVAVSETVALDAIQAHYVREVLPGEIVCLNADGSSQSVIYAVNSKPEQTCLLETLYFSRKKSFDGRQKIEDERIALGRAAARRFQTKNFKVDWVVPILNSGQVVASGVALELEKPIYEAIGVNGNKRSFIQNTQDERTKVVFEKHIVFSDSYSTQIAGKSILLCDDSAVRGTSLEGLIKKIKALQKNRPSQIHILLGSEPVSDICEWGIDLPHRENLLANKVGGITIAEIEQNVAKWLNVDSVTYLDRLSIETALHKSSNEMCYHCFGGPSPINSDREIIFREQVITKLKKQKVLFLASGNGSNVDQLLTKIEQQEILAKPVGVITNQSEAGVIKVAQQHHVPITILSSAGIKKSAAFRQQYVKVLLKKILSPVSNRPDVLVLAGWMLVLSSDFLKALAAANITILNLHPALISGTGEDHVMTSHGQVPELRGAQSVSETMSYSIIEMPVTGATVHLVSPNQAVDTGKIIIKEEVPRLLADLEDDLRHRIQQAEHRILSTALQRVLLEKFTK